MFTTAKSDVFVRHMFEVVLTINKCKEVHRLCNLLGKCVTIIHVHTYISQVELLQYHTHAFLWDLRVRFKVHGQQFEIGQLSFRA